MWSYEHQQWYCIISTVVRTVLLVKLNSLKCNPNMSSGDLWFRDTIKYFALAAISLIILTCLVWWKWTRFRQSHFRAHLLGFESECSELAAEHKQELFANLKHVISHDPILRGSHKLRLLEIGVKTGVKFFL